MCQNININHINVKCLGQNSNINIGKTLQNSHTSNFKTNGTNFTMGDGSSTASHINACFIDPDKSDQGQSESPGNENNQNEAAS
ncbi:spore germination protein [Neobacillus sp. D3-1R]|uniref:spore germination protein n=1 Tax=Neobacillus sp. D3-1R TaxID=3445778 RepID=UPI003FA0E167